MANQRISMRKIRDILRLREQNLSNRQIARSLSLSHSTVGDVLRRARAQNFTCAQVKDLDEAQLEAQLYPHQTLRQKEKHLPDFAYLHKELRRPGVTLQLLWEEYQLQHPKEGYQYSQFCNRYRAWAQKCDVVMRQHHRAGEKAFVDYSGSKLGITDPKTGEVTYHPLFVGCLGASQYTYAEVCLGQDLCSWLRAHVRMFDYFDGVPEILVPDNLKSGVKSPCFYEPDINPSYHRLACHYGVAVIPARVRKARDKAKVENAVLLVKRWILAALRNRTFFSLQEANEAIWELLEKLNDRPFKKIPGCRKSLFETLDRPCLRPLPEDPFVYAEYKKARVNIDYHVELHGHYYSVPYTLVHETVDLWFNNQSVEMTHQGKRLALYPYERTPGLHTTRPEHMPKSHRKYLQWSPSRILNWAKTLGPSVAVLTQAIMNGRRHPEQGYRSSLGIIRLEKSYGKDRLEAACKRALVIRGYSYRSVKSILEKGLDQLDLSLPPKPSVSENHENVRGQDYYQNENPSKKEKNEE